VGTIQSAPKAVTFDRIQAFVEEMYPTPAGGQPQLSVSVDRNILSYKLTDQKTSETRELSPSEQYGGQALFWQKATWMMGGASTGMALLSLLGWQQGSVFGLLALAGAYATHKTAQAFSRRFKIDILQPIEELQASKNSHVQMSAGLIKVAHSLFSENVWPKYSLSKVNSLNPTLYVPFLLSKISSAGRKIDPKPPDTALGDRVQEPLVSLVQLVKSAQGVPIDTAKFDFQNRWDQACALLNKRVGEFGDAWWRGITIPWHMAFGATCVAFVPATRFVLTYALSFMQ
jgi:hypothetical protein